MNKEEQEFMDAAGETLQLWAQGKFDKCPVNIAYMQINMMCGRLDRITEKLMEANDGAKQQD